MEYNDPPGYGSLKPLNRLRQKDLGKLLLIKPNLDSVWSINNTELSGSRGGGWAHSEKYFILSYSNIRTWRDCWHSWKYLTWACRSRQGVCSWLLLLLWSEGGESRHFDLLRWTLHHQMVIVLAHHSERLRGVRWTFNFSDWGLIPIFTLEIRVLNIFTQDFAWPLVDWPTHSPTSPELRPSL